MEVLEKVIGDVTLFDISGEFSIFYVDKIEELLKKRISEGKYKFVFVLRNTIYIDSMGISVLALAGHAAAEKGTKVIICCPEPRVKYTIELARIDEIIHFVDDEEEALEFFSKVR